jgi:hypothetical protein
MRRSPDSRAGGISTVDVAGERQRRVARPVVGSEKRADVVERGGLEILGGANRHPVIRMIRRIERGGDRHAGETVRTVLVVLPPLVEDDAPLVLELRFGQGRQQVAHAIRFHPQRQLQRVRGNDLPVVRAVGVGRAVEDAARFLQRTEVAFVVVLRALEHQVLEQVREPRAARLLVLRPDVVPHVHGDNRAGAVLVDDDVQAVSEAMMRERDLHAVVTS